MKAQRAYSIMHVSLILGVILFAFRFLLVPLGIPAIYLYPEIIACAIFLWIGMISIMGHNANGLFLALITTLAFVCVLLVL